MASWSEVTWLATSATCWVTSCACCCRDSRTPTPAPDRLASVCWYTVTGTLNVTVAVALAG